MKKILVSLVSDQTIQNVLLIKELSNIDRHIFISTDKMERDGKSAWIIQACEIPSDKFLKIIVIEDSLADIEEKLNAIDFDDDDEFYVNLTGGTKIMSIGVYNFFRYKRSEIYYIPIGKNIYRKIFPGVKNKDVPIFYRVGVTEYLKSYGIQILTKKMNALLKSSEETEKFYNNYIVPSQSDFEILNQLRNHRNDKEIMTNKIEGLNDYLQKVGFVHQTPDILKKDEIQYLTGGWFEEYVYNLIKEKLQLQKDSIAINIKIKRKDVENEFDVMFTFNNSIHVIECKTKIYDKSSDKNILNDSLYKLGAMKKDFGLFVKSYIFTLSNRGSEKHNVRDLYYKRGQLLDIKIVDKTALLQEFDAFINKIVS